MEGTKSVLEKSQISSNLTPILGADKILDMDAADSKYRLKAYLKALPEDEGQVSEVLRFANDNGLSVIPQGGGTKDAYGQSTQDADLILSLKSMSGVLDYSASDLMVTVLAGTTLKELQATLKATNQFLPLDVAWDDESTIGGIINSSASGTLRAGYGSVRDFLIASRIVYPDGNVIRTGAKVVKNVAGYDMNKLFIGSMGTLGVHTEFTFKIRPIPAEKQIIVISNCPVETLRKIQETVLDSHLEPCVFEWLNQETARHIHVADKGPALLLGFADVQASVEQQVGIAKEFCLQLGAEILAVYRSSEEIEPVLTAVRNLLPNANQTENGRSIASLKMMGKLTDIQAMYETSESRSKESGIPLHFSAGALIGIGRATVESAGTEQSDKQLAAWIQNMQSDLKKIGIRTVVDFAPKSVRDQISIWGEMTADQTIMREIKRKIDPNEILNPGRIMGGL